MFIRAEGKTAAPPPRARPRAKGRPRKRAAAVKRRAGRRLSSRRFIWMRSHPSLPLAPLCDCIYVGRSRHLWAVIQDFKGAGAADAEVR